MKQRIDQKRTNGSGIISDFTIVWGEKSEKAFAMEIMKALKVNLFD